MGKTGLNVKTTAKQKTESVSNRVPHGWEACWVKTVGGLKNEKKARRSFSKIRGLPGFMGKRPGECKMFFPGRMAAFFQKMKFVTFEK
ncbi:MAG: hypothetical protein R3D58_00755 [Saprospiraceae bacterium]